MNILFHYYILLNYIPVIQGATAATKAQTGSRQTTTATDHLRRSVY